MATVPSQVKEVEAAENIESGLEMMKKSRADELEKAAELRNELDDVRRERRGLEAEWDGLVIRL